MRTYLTYITVIIYYYIGSVNRKMSKFAKPFVSSSRKGNRMKKNTRKQNKKPFAERTALDNAFCRIYNVI